MLSVRTLPAAGKQREPLHDLKCTACHRPHCDAWHTLSLLSWKCWVMTSQYHLIMMSSRIRFATGLVDGTSVWFSLVLAWGAMSWKAIRPIKRSTGMVWAAACAQRRSEVARERGWERDWVSSCLMGSHGGTWLMKCVQLNTPNW